MERRKVNPSQQLTQPIEGMLPKRPTLWIRPRKVSVEVRKLATYHFLPPLRVHWSTLLRLSVNLLGIAIVICSFFLISKHTFISSHAPVISMSLPKGCLALHPCKRVENVSLAPPLYLNPRAISTIQPIFTPTPHPILMATTGPTPPPSTPVPTPSPSVAMLEVSPTSFSVSYKSTCKFGGSFVLRLANTGGQVLVWWEDKAITSPGVSIVDTTNLYLLQPGQSVSANVFCSAKNTRGHKYLLQIDYDGGKATIDVLVT